MGLHERNPLAVGAKVLGREHSVVVAEELDDVLILGHRSVVGKARSFGVESQKLFGLIERAVVRPEVRHASTSLERPGRNRLAAISGLVRFDCRVPNRRRNDRLYLF